MSRLEDSQKLAQLINKDDLADTLREDLAVAERHLEWARKEVEAAERDVKASQKRLEGRILELREKIASE